MSYDTCWTDYKRHGHQLIPWQALANGANWNGSYHCHLYTSDGHDSHWCLLQTSQAAHLRIIYIYIYIYIPDENACSGTVDRSSVWEQRVHSRTCNDSSYMIVTEPNRLNTDLAMCHARQTRFLVSRMWQHILLFFMPKLLSHDRLNEMLYTYILLTITL